MQRALIILITIHVIAASLAAQEIDSSMGRRPLEQSQVNAVSALFRYDREIPLDVRVLDRLEDSISVREKFVFTGVRGDRVPGYFAVPKTGRQPYPIVLLLHAGAFSKDSWWNNEGYGGLPLTKVLLKSGVAVLALDAQFHGERTAKNDYLPIRPMFFERKWLHRIRELYVESVGDYRRALDYLSSKSQLDLSKVGAVGHSTGGIMALQLAALDSRVKTVVAAVAALSDPWLYPITPTNLAKTIRVSVLLMAGRFDGLIPMADTEKLYSTLEGPKDLVVYESKHQLPDENNQKAAEWLLSHLQNR